jgi:RsiW-degrading membrane proteinase PrsW (M82 family)
MAFTVGEIIAVLLAAIGPPMLYIFWVRSKELCDRNQLRSLLAAFVVGGTFSLGVAFLIESALVTLLFGSEGLLTRPFWNLDPQDPSFQLIVLACIMAPLVEEMTKAWGVLLFRGRLAELKNGLVYGAAVGLGFAAVENVLYEASAITIGLDVFVGTAILRALTSTMLHASATSITGFGISRSIVLRQKGEKKSWLPYYGLAVILHGSFNLLAIMGEVSGSQFLYILGLGLAVVLVASTFDRILKKVADLDALLCAQPLPKST